MDIKRILILSASFGEGHRQAANAIKEAFALRHPEIEIEVVDYIHQVNPVWNRFAKFCYIQGIKHIPKVYGYFYKQINRIPPSSPYHRRVNLFGAIIGRNKLLKYITSFDPQIVIHTFPTSASAVEELKREHKLDIPSVTVITDYALHRQWIHKSTDLYFVGSRLVRDLLLQEGVAAEKIRITGIPIRQEFYHQFDREQINQELGLDPQIPTVLVSGGAYGVSCHINNLCKHLFDSDEKVQVIVVCGRNKRLYEHMQERAATSKNKALIYGFVNRMADLMSVSDLMFTKSGGLTTSEGIKMELPMIFFKPIPGQELANAKYLERAGVAQITSNDQQLEAVFHTLISNPDQLQAMKDGFKALKADIIMDSLDRVILDMDQMVQRIEISQ